MSTIHELLIDTEDYRGKRVIFTEAKRLEKSAQHAELNNKQFLKNIEPTIKDPDEVWPDYSDKNRKACYYKKYSATTYVKVVVWIYSNPCHVVTAYETDKIKEMIYPELNRIK